MVPYKFLFTELSNFHGKFEEGTITGLKFKVNILFEAMSKTREVSNIGNFFNNRGEDKKLFQRMETIYRQISGQPTEGDRRGVRADRARWRYERR